MTKNEAMIDTVILAIPRGSFTNAEGGNVLGWSLHSKTSNYQKFVRNPSFRERQANIYMPRLTGMKRRVGHGTAMQEFLKIEFSVPKLIFGNNVDEVTDKDFPLVLKTLQARLRLAGVAVKLETLSKAAVTAFHPSKNFALTDGYTAQFVGRELSKINLNKKFDLDKTSFRNDGQSLQGYTISHSIVFYDKIADLAKDKKRAIDKDPTPKQGDLFRQIKAQGRSLEVLRLEIRLTQKAKFNAVLSKLGYPKNPTFKAIFKKAVCQDIVRHYWETLVLGENLFLFEAISEPKKILKEIFRKYKSVKPKEAIYLTGLNLLAKDDAGIRGLRAIVEKHTTARNWYRFGTDLKRLTAIRQIQECHGWVDQIEQGIETFEAFRWQDYPQKVDLQCKEL